MSEFYYLGQLPASKSLYNRALVVQSYFSNFQMQGDSQADDVVAMKAALESLTKREPMDCRHAGTVLRFLSVRASRETGEFYFQGSPRLFSRLQKDLTKLLSQLGSEVTFKEDGMILRSFGWHPMGDSLHVPTTSSSQFASAVLLNCWQLKKPFYFTLGHNLASESYWQMTVELVKQLGMKMETFGRDYHVPAHQEIQTRRYEVEPDVSCAFALAAIAAVSGHCTLKPFPQSSLQPDVVFVDFLKRMGVPVTRSANQLSVHKAAHGLSALQADLSQCPDLFPVLAVLCALARGKSRLFGAPHLVHKESNRIQKTQELLTGMGCGCEALADGLEITGPARPALQQWTFDSDHDHRIAMAAAVAKKAGWNIEILRPEVVSKSFPGFWERIGVKP